MSNDKPGDQNLEPSPEIVRRLESIEAKLTEGPSKSSKDIWDKLGSLTTLVSSVVLGAAGLIATNLIQNKELEVKHLDAGEERARLERQAKTTSLLEQTKILESLLKYVASPKPE